MRALMSMLRWHRGWWTRTALTHHSLSMGDHHRCHRNMLICARVTRGSEGDHLTAHTAARRLNGKEDGDRRERLD